MITKEFRGMKYRRMGYSGLWISEIGLGLWKWGDPAYDGSRVGEHEGFKILDKALELGITHFDTANSYNAGSGNSERLLGRFFSSRGEKVRDEIVLATKVRNSVRDEHVLNQDFSPNERGASRKYVIQAVEDSLKRLQTDRIDILYHHFPDTLSDGSWETPLEETWDAMNTLVNQGKVRYLAVSNRSKEQLKQEIRALGMVASNVSRRIIGVQNGYNLLQRYKVTADENLRSPADETDFLNFISENKIGLVPYIPLAVGLLTGRYRKSNIDYNGRLSQKANEPWRDEFINDNSLDKVEKLIGIAEQKGCTLAQLANAWLLSHDEVCSVITGVTKMEHVIDNAKSVQVTLTEDELMEINNIVDF